MEINWVFLPRPFNQSQKNITYHTKSLIMKKTKVHRMGHICTTEHGKLVLETELIELFYMVTEL